MEIFSKDLLMQQKGGRHDNRRAILLQRDKKIVEEKKMKARAKAWGVGSTLQPQIVTPPSSRAPSQSNKPPSSYRDWEDLNETNVDKQLKDEVPSDSSNVSFPTSSSASKKQTSTLPRFLAPSLQSELQKNVKINQQKKILERERRPKGRVAKIMKRSEEKKKGKEKRNRKVTEED